MIIKKIRIKNFRSITDIQVDLSDLTVIMGDNDAGKSNILRAINLFFNNTTDSDKPFSFPYDFNKNATVAINKAKEIIIEITFSPPSNYKEKKDILWRKIWRRDGLFSEREMLSFVDGTEFSSRSKINIWLSRIKFKYVPATKGADYFSQLLGELHDSLSNTVDDQIKAAAKGFTSTINKHTKKIFDELDDRLGIKSSIQLPSDLKILFANLDFQSDKNLLSLQQRGDGIKARHIPIILRFLADQDNALRDRGSAKFNHIWGYEEPENNLEMTKAFALASDFKEYSNEVQVLLTTHSPAFYGLHTQGAAIHHISKDLVTAETVTRAVDLTLSGELDEMMGVMPIISPYVATAVKGYKELLAKADDLRKAQIKKPTLFVEGPSDVAILKKAFSVFSSDALNSINIQASSKHGGGEGWVTDMLIAWMHNREEISAGGLFDNDEQGKIGKKKVVTNQKYPEQKSVRVFTFDNPPHLHEIFQAKLKIGVCLEEITLPACWQHAEEKGWLAQRQDLPKLNANLVSDFNVSIKDAISKKKLSLDSRLYLENKISSEHKEAFSKYVSKLEPEEAKVLLSGFKQTVLSIAAHLVP